MGPSNAIQFPGAMPAPAATLQYGPAPTGGKPVPNILPDKAAGLPPPIAPVMAPIPQAPPMSPIEHPAPTATEVPKAAMILGTVHTYAQMVPWFVWLGVGASAAYLYNRKR